jgi:16S rRNA U1498 N3-methylase RsmE
MPLYEVVLRFPDHDEIRLTDRDGYQVDDKIDIARRTYVVVGLEPPQWPKASKRLVLEPVEPAAS